MNGGNSYVFEMSGGNSRVIQQIPSRKRMQTRQSFGANGKMNACRSAIHSQTKEKPPAVEKRADSRRPTPGRQLLAANSR